MHPIIGSWSAYPKASFYHFWGGGGITDLMVMKVFKKLNIEVDTKVEG
jgi:hypothetical protein